MSRASRPRVAAVTAFEEPETSVALYKRGYAVFRKDLTPAAVVSLVRSLLEAPLDGVGLVVQRYALTPREAEVLRLTMEGVPRDDIADALGCKARTVRAHWHHILQKTGCCRYEQVLLLCSQLRQKTATPPKRLFLTT